MIVYGVLVVLCLLSASVVALPHHSENFGLRSIGADVPRNRVHRTFSQADYEAAIDQLNDPSTKQTENLNDPVGTFHRNRK